MGENMPLCLCMCVRRDAFFCVIMQANVLSVVVRMRTLTNRPTALVCLCRWRNWRRGVCVCV